MIRGQWRIDAYHDIHPRMSTDVASDTIRHPGRVLNRDVDKISENTLDNNIMIRSEQMCPHFENNTIF